MSVLVVLRGAVVQAGRGQVLALLWMVLLVWQLWVPQNGGGSGSVRGALPHIPSACWGGRILCLVLERARTGATARGRLTEGLQPVAVSSLTVKGAGGPQAGGGRRPLAAGCWLIGSEPRRRPQGAERCWDRWRRGRVGGPPHLPTMPGATGKGFGVSSDSVGDAGS